MTRRTTAAPPVVPAAQLQRAGLSLGGRQLWRDLELTVAPGEFLAVLGPNGSGKSSLLRVLLGLTPLATGRAEVLGRPPRRGSSAIGYVPQQKSFDPDLPVRGRDLVHFGLDGHRYGGSAHTAEAVARVDQAIAAVGA
ncbi:MAG TPA: ATP-binding cassette domain-containing protein, partial [Candidatus Saccharimonadia bacterium]|nr:ATP-binding cassette domain-containing protein [Candidatus Saccharimonadia bacterium]